jgi:hypothetical protein
LDFTFQRLPAPSRLDDCEQTEIITTITASHSMSHFSTPFLTFGCDDRHKPHGCGTSTSLESDLTATRKFFFFFFISLTFSYVQRSVDARIRSWFSLTQALSRGILYISYPRKGIIGSKSSVLISFPILSCPNTTVWIRLLFPWLRSSS